MEKIRSVVLIACLLAVAISILDMLYPGKKFERQVRFIFSLVFLIGLATPFLTGGVGMPSISLSENKYTDITAAVDSQVKEGIAGNIEKALERRLVSEGLAVKKISVSVTISGEDSIFISEVKIVPQDNKDSGRIKEIAGGELGEGIKIDILEGESDG